MRIALISEHASPLAALGGVDAGGQNTHVADLAAALAAREHEVTVYTRRDSRDQPESVAVPAGYTVIHVPAGPPEPTPKDELLPHMAAFGSWLARRWRDSTPPDVVHAHFWMSGLAAIVAATPSRTPITLTYHALGSVKRRHQGTRDTSPAYRIAYERMLGNRVDRVVAQCHDEVRELVALGVPRSRISVVPPGVDSALFTPDGPAAPRGEADFRVLSVSRLVPRKGLQDVIRSLRWVPNAECVIIGGSPGAAVGSQPFEKRLLAVAADAGVAGRVRFVGAVPREEMPAWYRSADLLVTVPWYEPFGLTPLEAMAAGVPVVAAEVGGLADTVIDGVTGDLVPPHDPQRLGRAVRRLMEDPARRLGYATAAVDRARTMYSWRRAAEQLSTVYLAVAAQATGAVA